MGTTATQKLTFPDTTDDPRLHWQFLKTLALQVDSRAQTHANLVAAGVIPKFAMVTAIAQTLQVLPADPALGYITFNTVVADTAGLADFTQNRQILTLNDLGYWLVGINAAIQGLGCTNGGVFNRLNVDNGLPSQFTAFSHDPLLGHLGISCTGLVRVNDLSFPVTVYNDFVSNGTGCPASLPLIGAMMWACKMRDL
jgi:hypothetical protein